jgi:hypothetical protein
LQSFINEASSYCKLLSWGHSRLSAGSDNSEDASPTNEQAAPVGNEKLIEKTGNTEGGRHAENDEPYGKESGIGEKQVLHSFRAFFICIKFVSFGWVSLEQD